MGAIDAARGEIFPVSKAEIARDENDVINVHLKLKFYAGLFEVITGRN